MNDSPIFDVATDLYSYEVTPEEVPTGDTTEDRRMRQEIIKRFYYHWKIKNPDLYKFNDDLGENIYINHTSLVETAGRASLTYLSTLAVLQLDAILQNATLQFVDKPKPGNKHQAKFEKMLLYYIIDSNAENKEKRAALRLLSYIHPEDTCGNYFKSQGIAGGDLCTSESPSFHVLSPQTQR